MNLDAKEIAEAKSLLKKNNLRVTDVAGPLFKVDWPGAPKSKFSPEHDSFGANFTYAQQGEVLDRAIAMAREFSTDRIRCFDFWRLDDQAPHRKAMNEQLQQTAEKLRKIGMILILENEFACNTATGAEGAPVTVGVAARNVLRDSASPYRSSKEFFFRPPLAGGGAVPLLDARNPVRLGIRPGQLRRGGQICHRTVWIRIKPVISAAHGRTWYWCLAA